jgi:TusA-related sulfurtransferase
MLVTTTSTSRKVHILDVRGTIIPITLLKVTHAFREMNPGETIEILIGDGDAREDLFRVLPVSFYEVIEIKEEESFCGISLKKGPGSLQGR